MSPLLWLLLACDGTDSGLDSGEAPSAAEQCIADNPASGDVADNVDEVLAECEASGGTGCAAASLISSAAAVCIAESDGLAAGVVDWQVWMVFHNTYLRPVWNVDQTAYQKKDGTSGGEGVSIDAVTGEILGRSAWEGQP